MKRIQSARWLIAAATLWSGCATFRAGMTPSQTVWPPASGTTGKVVALTVRADSEVNGKRASLPDAALAQLRGRIWELYDESGLFSDVKTGLEEADVLVDVHLSNTGHSSTGMAILTGVTMFLVPTKAVDSNTMTTRFTNMDGDVLAVIEKHDEMTTWIQLFMLFVPGRNTVATGAEMVTDMVRATIVDARSQGVFD